MRKNKFLVSIMVLVAVFMCLSVPAFAAAEPEQSEPETTEPVSGVVLDGATVNVSQESIQAIADAVANASSDDGTFRTFVAADGTVFSFEITENTAAFYDEYPYFIVTEVTSTSWYFFFSKTPSFNFVNDDDGRIRLYPASYTMSTHDLVIKDNTGVVNGTDFSFIKHKEKYVVSPDDVIFSYGHLYLDGVLVYESDVPLYYDVSFNSGFDDLIIPDQYSDRLVLPTPEKEGYIFLGWYLDPDYMTVYTADYLFTADTTLYAKWTEEPPMAFFSESLFASLTVLLESPPIFYLVSLMGLVLVIGIIKVFVSARL